MWRFFLVCVFDVYYILRVSSCVMLSCLLYVVCFVHCARHVYVIREENMLRLFLVCVFDVPYILRVLSCVMLSGLFYVVCFVYCARHVCVIGEKKCV